MRSTLVMLAISAVAVAASSAEVTEPFSKTVPLTADGSFSIENVNGPVSVETWDRNEVEILATRKAPDAATLERVTIEVEASAEKVSVSTKMKEHTNTNGASVDYRIHAPRNAKLHMEVVNGALRVLDPSGAVDANSVNGSIAIGNAAGPVSAESVNGAVEVGYVKLAEGKHDYHAVNGHLTLHMPAAPSGQFQASTVNGDISTDFPLEVHKAKYGPQRSLSGKLGQGGPAVSLATVNGAIEIRGGGESVASRFRSELDKAR